MINKLYSFIGLALDILVIALPLIKLKKNSKREVVIAASLIFMTTKIIMYIFLYENIAKYIVFYFILCFTLFKIKGIKLYYLYMYVLYGTILFSFDYIGYVLFSEKTFFLYTILYKLILIIFLNNFKIELDNKLKMKMLSGASVTLIILISIIIGGA